MTETKSRLITNLAGYAYPAMEPVGQNGKRFLRRWIVRTVRVLPNDTEIGTLALRIAGNVKATLRSAYEEHASEAALLESAPVIDLVRIDETHCVAEIETPSAEQAVGDTAAIATWMTLRAIDEAFGIEDLEGLPKKMWFQLT